MELSVQPSPIDHHDSLPHRGREPAFSREPIEGRGTDRDLAYRKERPNVGAGEAGYPLELPRVSEQKYPMELPVVLDRYS